MWAWLPLAGEKRTESPPATTSSDSLHVRFNMITQEILKEVFDYSDGFLIWKKKISKKVVIGKQAGYNRKGYTNIGIYGKEYPAHSLIYLWHFGKYPKVIDHINRDKKDNRIENLREATFQQNSANSRTPSHNTSGYKGVCFDKKHKKFMAHLTLNGKFKFIGYFETAAEASDAYFQKAKEVFGEFASKQ